MPVIRPDPFRPPAPAGPARGIDGTWHSAPTITETPVLGSLDGGSLDGRSPDGWPPGGLSPISETPPGGDAARPGAPNRRSSTLPERAACPNR